MPAKHAGLSQTMLCDFHYETKTHENPVKLFMVNSQEIQRFLMLFSWHFQGIQAIKNQ